MKFLPLLFLLAACHAPTPQQQVAQHASLMVAMYDEELKEGVISQAEHDSLVRGEQDIADMAAYPGVP